MTGEFVRAGAFSGREWQTDAMRQLAGKVPTIGKAFVVGSEKKQRCDETAAITHAGSGAGG